MSGERTRIFQVLYVSGTVLSALTFDMLNFNLSLVTLEGRYSILVLHMENSHLSEEQRLDN